jgi:hypothetical protein
MEKRDAGMGERYEQRGRSSTRYRYFQKKITYTIEGQRSQVYQLQQLTDTDTRTWTNRVLSVFDNESLGT